VPNNTPSQKTPTQDPFGGGQKRPTKLKLILLFRGMLCVYRNYDSVTIYVITYSDYNTRGITDHKDDDLIA
jgi:hypothetical protein